MRRDGSAIRQEVSLSLRSDGGLVWVARDIGERHRSAFALILLGDDYLLGSLRLSIQRALFSRISAACGMACANSAASGEKCRRPRVR